jgi:hypothetical protein
MTVPLRAALYLRVSTARQAEHDCEFACKNDPLRGVFRVQSRPL